MEKALKGHPLCGLHAPAKFSEAVVEHKTEACPPALVKLGDILGADLSDAGSKCWGA